MNRSQDAQFQGCAIAGEENVWNPPLHELPRGREKWRYRGHSKVTDSCCWVS